MVDKPATAEAELDGQLGTKQGCANVERPDLVSTHSAHEGVSNHAGLESGLIHLIGFQVLDPAHALLLFPFDSTTNLLGQELQSPSPEALPEHADPIKPAELGNSGQRSVEEDDPVHFFALF